MSGAMIRVDVTVDGMDKLLHRLDPAQVEIRMRGGMRESLAYLQGEVQRNVPVYQGLLRGSIFTDIEGNAVGGMRGIVASPLAHAPVVEFGRKPGGKMPPVEPLELWARRVLGVEGLGLAIARKIKHKGTKGHHMFRDAAKKGTATVAAIFRKHLARV